MYVIQTGTDGEMTAPPRSPMIVIRVIITKNTTTTTCVPSCVCPRSRTTLEVVVRRALWLYVY